MKTLFVFYDAECAFCLRCRKWLEAQPAWVELRFIPRQSPDAERLFHGIGAYTATDDLVVASDEGAVYCGPSAFIMCLYALEDYREISLRLAQPALLPFSRKAFTLISQYRDTFSRWLKNWKDDQLAAALSAAKVSECNNNSLSCAPEAKSKELENNPARPAFGSKWPDRT